MIPPGYTVTRDGRIMGRAGDWLKPELIGGQPSIRVQVGGVRRRMMVGRLVCEVFHGPPPTPGHIAEHIDGDPLNNHADNLRWSPIPVVVRRAHTGKEKPTIQGEDHHAAILTWELVRIIRQKYADGSATKTHLSRQYGVSDMAIHYIIINKSWRDPEYTPPPPRT